jgi:hypothetical protein
MKADIIPLPDLASELRAMGIDPPPSYRSLYVSILDGALPARKVSGRYFIARCDLPEVAAFVAPGRVTEAA